MNRRRSAEGAPTAAPPPRVYLVPVPKVCCVEKREEVCRVEKREEARRLPSVIVDERYATREWKNAASSSSEETHSPRGDQLRTRSDPRPRRPRPRPAPPLSPPPPRPRPPRDPPRFSKLSRLSKSRSNREPRSGRRAPPPRPPPPRPPPPRPPPPRPPPRNPSSPRYPRGTRRTRRRRRDDRTRRRRRRTRRLRGRVRRDPTRNHPCSSRVARRDPRDQTQRVHRVHRVHRVRRVHRRNGVLDRPIRLRRRRRIDASAAAGCPTRQSHPRRRGIRRGTRRAAAYPRGNRARNHPRTAIRAHRRRGSRFPRARRTFPLFVLAAIGTDFLRRRGSGVFVRGDRPIAVVSPRAAPRAEAPRAARPRATRFGAGGTAWRRAGVDPSRRRPRRRRARREARPRVSPRPSPVAGGPRRRIDRENRSRPRRGARGDA